MPVTGVDYVRIMFTVVAAGARELDVIVHAGAYAMVSEVAELLGAERLYVGPERLIPTHLATEAIRDGCRVGLDRPVGEPAWPAASANTGTVPPLATAPDGPALLVRRPPRLTPPPPQPQTFTVPPRPASRSLRRRRERQAHDEERARIEKAADDARAADEAWWRAEYPDPAALFDIAAAPGSRLWERRPGDPDFLTLRAGNGTRPSLVSVHDPATGRERRLTLTDVPLTVSLARDSGVLGVACPPDAAAELTWAGPDRPGGPARAVCRWLVAQLAVLRSPADLRVCLLTDQSGHDDWAWHRWLPHCRPPREKTALTWVGNDEGTAAARIADVLGIIEGRRRGDQPYPVVVVVFDGWSRFRSEPGVSQILRTGPEFGVYAICADAELPALPQECGTIIEPDGQGELEQLRLRGRESGGGLPDLVDPAWCEGIARALAPLRDGDALGSPGLGEVNRLPDLLNLASSAPEAIKRRWRGEGGMASAVIGESGDGPFSIDLRRDGPHALIAGTTGSGKSELLQTIVASYAAASPPDAITFLLIDYKGGSAFKDCVDLPHTVGLIVDFDLYESERVLTSLAAELRRREILLYSVEVKDVEDYITLRGRRAGLKPLPRLVIMVDEFASLARELPGFISGLMNIAQRGRSLGGHAAARRGGFRGYPGEHQPADRAARVRPRREPGGHRGPGRRVDPGHDSGPRLRPRGPPRADPGAVQPGQRSRAASTQLALARTRRLGGPRPSGATPVTGAGRGRNRDQPGGTRRRRPGGQRLPALPAAAPALAARAAGSGAAE
jgi:hypothetical protein